MEKKKLSAADTIKLLHELQVSHIELEMQNNELKKAKDTIESGAEKYTQLFDFAPIGYLTLNSLGRIAKANILATTILGMSKDALLKKNIHSFIPTSSRYSFDKFFNSVISNFSLQVCETVLINFE